VTTLDLSIHAGLSTIKAFSEGLKKGGLVYNLCRRCSQKHLPPRLYCSICGSTDLEVVQLEASEGKVVAYTLVNYPPARYRGEEPYGLAIIEFKNGLRITGRIKIKDGSIADTVGREAKLMVDVEKPDFWFLVT
jgi:uncharacterized OB-fold protein